MSKPLEQLRSENHRHFETRTSNIMLALKKEITHLQLEQKNRMLELKFEREQFKKKHRCHGDRGQSSRRKKSHKRPPSFQAQIDRWMTSVRKFCVDTGPKIYFPEEDDKEQGEVIQPGEECSDKTERSIKDSVTPSSGLPRIELSPCSVNSRVNFGPFVTKIKEDDNFTLDIPEDIQEGVDLPRINSLRKISCISLPNRRPSMPIVNRLRSTSMPGMSMRSRMQIEASLARNSNSNSNSNSNNLDSSRDTARRHSDIPISGQRNSVGVSTSRVISDLNRGIMYRDLDEQEEEGEIADEVWTKLSHCRYLRNHRYSLP